MGRSIIQGSFIKSKTSGLVERILRLSLIKLVELQMDLKPTKNG